MTNRLKMELLKLQLRLKHNNPDALVFEEAKVNLRKLWRAAYAEAGVRTVSECFIRCATRMRLTWQTRVWSCRSLLVSWATAT